MFTILAELEALIRDFTTRLVAAVDQQMAQRIRSVVSAALGDSSAVPKRAVREPRPVAGDAPVRRKLKLSAKALAVRKLQGQYLGVLRGLKPDVRERVKKVTREKGVAAAIKFAGTLK